MDQFPGLEIYYFVSKSCGINWRLPRGIHPVSGMIIVLHGEALYRINGKNYSVRAGNFIYTKPGMEREASTTGMVCAAFDFTVLTGSLDFPILSQFNKTDELIRLIKEFQYEWMGKAPGFHLKCSGIFLLILHELKYSNITSENYYVEKIKHYIVDHYSEPIRMETIASFLGLNPVYCGALFHRIHGMTIKEFTNKVRIQRAASILHEERMRLSAVAYMCGFSDVYYFSKTFKKIMGISPSRWERQYI